MSVATLTSKGQLTLPKTIRELLHVGPGDKLDFVVDDNGDVLVRPIPSAQVTELKGLLYRADRPAVSLEEMDAAIMQAHGKRA